MQWIKFPFYRPGPESIYQYGAWINISFPDKVAVCPKCTSLYYANVAQWCPTIFEVAFIFSFICTNLSIVNDRSFKKYDFLSCQSSSYILGRFENLEKNPFLFHIT